MSSFNYTMPGANVASAIIQIETIQDLIASGNPNLLTSGQANAMANLYGLFSANPGGFPNSNYPYFTDANGKDMVVFAGVINNLAALGPTLTYEEAVAAAGSVTPISSASFPVGANTVVYNDTYFLCEFPGTFEFANSAQGDGTTWTPFPATAEAASDPILALDQLNGQLVVFKQTTIQYFIDIGSPVSGVPGTTTYQNIPGSTQQYGLAAIYSRAPFQGTIAFLGQNFQGAVQVFVINGYTPTPISTPDINNLINSFTYVNDACAFSYTVDGHEMYEITFPIAGYSFLYDGYTQLWSILQSGVGDSGRHNVQLGCSFNYNNFVSDFISGNIYYYDINSNTDNGEPIKRMLITRHIFDQGNQFGIDQVWLDMDIGQGTQPQYVPNGYVTVPNSNTFIITTADHYSACGNPTFVNPITPPGYAYDQYSTANGTGWFYINSYYPEVGSINTYPVYIGSNTIEAIATTSAFYQPNTSLLLHFDSANGSSVIIDSSSHNYPMTVYGSPHINSASYFGNGAGQFVSVAGSGWYTPMTANGPLDLKHQSFSVSCWLKNQGAGSIVWSDWDFNSEPDFIRGYVNAVESGYPTLQMDYSTGMGTGAQISTPTNDGNWHFIVWQANTISGNCAVAMDGVWGPNGSFTVPTAASQNQYYRVGFDGSSPIQDNSFIGEIDEFCVIVGNNQPYTMGTSFTPPTAPFGPLSVVYPNTPNIILVEMNGTQPQNTFTSMSFTDRYGNTEVYETSAATYDTVNYTGYTIWAWPPNNSGNTVPWSMNANVAVTFTWGSQNVITSLLPAGFPYSSDPQITMYVSKDGGRTYGNPRSKPMGKVGQYRGPRVVWNRLGSGRDFVLKFVVTDNVPFILNQGAVTLRPGTEGT